MEFTLKAVKVGSHFVYLKMRVRSKVNKIGKSSLYLKLRNVGTITGSKLDVVPPIDNIFNKEAKMVVFQKSH